VSTPGGAKLEGTAKLNRLEFGVGQGDWKSTESVKDVVKVAFSLILKPRSLSE
jgi:polyisoprenoid-binding protein YceI